MQTRQRFPGQPTRCCAAAKRALAPLQQLDGPGPIPSPPWAAPGETPLVLNESAYAALLSGRLSVPTAVEQGVLADGGTHSATPLSHRPSRTVDQKRCPECFYYKVKEVGVLPVDDFDGTLCL